MVHTFVYKWHLPSPLEAKYLLLAKLIRIESLDQVDLWKKIQRNHRVTELVQSCCNIKK